MVVRSVSYLDIISLSGSFIGLDISVRSTGWCKWLRGEFTSGVFALTEEEPVRRRHEFANFVKSLCGEDMFEYVIVEDVIASCNFKTAKILIQLNSIVDDLIFAGSIQVGMVIREDNKVWKKHLRQLAGYEGKILAGKDKQMVLECMQSLEFLGKHQQDVYDVVGMSLGVIKRTILDGEVVKTRKLKKDISKGYKIKQFSDEDTALCYANKLSLGGRGLELLDMRGSAADLTKTFKKAVEVCGDDKVFIISVLTTKLGVVALHKNLSLEDDMTYLVCHTK